MPLHLVRNAPGIADVAAFEAALRASARRLPGFETPVCLDMTRNSPRREAELLDGGSIYWNIKRALRARTELLDVRRVPAATAEGRPITVTALIFSPTVVPVRPQEHPRFQGWRYLEASAAPPDGAPGDDALPDALRRELAELGLL
jgi:hypothetical protein